MKRRKQIEKFTGKATRFVALLTLICFIAFPNQSSAAPLIDYVETVQNHSGIIIDTRPDTACEQASFSGARCLPASDFFAANKRLANFSGVLWLLGTAGITGNEHVLVVGDKSTAKEAIGGLLLLAGQSRISILTKPVDISIITNPDSGNSRSNTREEVFQAQMRSERIMLSGELAALLRGANPPIVLDGRSEAEYWGGTIRGHRGGHISNALHLPLKAPVAGKKSRLPFNITDEELPVAYAQDTYQSLIYIARLEAHDLAASLLFDGWAGWASDGALPVDAQSFADQRPIKLPTVLPIESGQGSQQDWIKIAGYLIVGFSLIVGGYIAGRTFALAKGRS